MNHALEEAPTAQVVYRPYRDADADFFYRSFLDSYGLGSPVTVHIPKSVFYPAQRALIQRLVARPRSRLVVACLKDDPAVLIGFLLAEMLERPVVHYVYTKGPFRRMGFARGMLAVLGIDPRRCRFTHWTYDTTALAQKWPGAKFNPYLATEHDHGS